MVYLVGCRTETRRRFEKALIHDVTAWGTSETHSVRVNVGRGRLIGGFYGLLSVHKRVITNLAGAQRRSRAEGFDLKANCESKAAGTESIFVKLNFSLSLSLSLSPSP